MTIDDIDRATEEIGKLSRKGVEIISILKEYIQAEFADSMKIETASTETRLLISFFGIRMEFGVEIGWSNEEVVASIAAKSISGNPQQENYLHAVKYDKLGNIDRRRVPEDLPVPFLEAVFTALTQRQVKLQP